MGSPPARDGALEPPAAAGPLGGFHNQSAAAGGLEQGDRAGRGGAGLRGLARDGPARSPWARRRHRAPGGGGRMP